MVERVIPEATEALVETIGDAVKGFYLAGGTGLSLQLSHRMSADLDFFSEAPFNNDVVLDRLNPDRILFTSEGTVHCEKDSVKISLLYYREPLMFPLIAWHGIMVADLKDIAAEKIKAISQRGTKRDFYDLYAIITMRLSIAEVCGLFIKRFKGHSINRYHMLKSLVYFNDADAEPDPVILAEGSQWQWSTIRQFFERHIKDFEAHLLDEEHL